VALLHPYLYGRHCSPTQNIRKARHKDGIEQFTVGIILLWMYDLSEEFISLLSSSNAMGLTILAHYATLLYRQNHVWWIEGLGSTLIGAISAILGEEWADILAWPKKVANIT